MSARRLSFYLLLGAVVLVSAGIPMKSASPGSDPTSDETIIVGRNVNMVSGTQLPGGDPYLQRQNEPSGAASTRNHMHLLFGANDYRTIDMPFADQVPGVEIGTGVLDRDAWLGVFKSYDGGQSWISTLLPGYPQDTSDEGSLSPLKAFGTAADPVVKAGTNGIFYYAGMAFNRVDRGSGVVFVARYIDLNNQENGDTIKYDGVNIIDQGNAGQFLDKPWIAVDIPRSGSGQALFSGQTASVPCGNVYITYSAFVGKTDTNIRSKILFARSTDCGHTWSAPIKISESQHTDQAATIAIDPNSGAVYVAWRRFMTSSQTSAMIIVKSTDGGLTFTKPAVVRNLGLSFPPSAAGPFDQKTSNVAFRTNSYPTTAVDDKGLIYMAWAERKSNLYSRIFITCSADAINWKTPVLVDDTGVGHQFMPTLTFAGGKLMLAWYDQRNDISLNSYGCNPANPGFVEDNPCRHTIDVRLAQIDPIGSISSNLVIHGSQQVSRYLCTYETDPYGNPVVDNEGYLKIVQLQHDFSGLSMFAKGTSAFMGDYIDIMPAPIFLPPSLPGASWKYNTDLPSTVYHIAWTDTRDVAFPLRADGTPNLWPNWGLYKAPNSLQDDPLFPDPSGCSGNLPGIMNQNVYTSCISPGFIASSPGNTKPLSLEDNPHDTNDQIIPRAFTVDVKNISDFDKNFTLTITSVPTGVTASFFQYFDVPGDQFPTCQLVLGVAAHSSISQPVFVYADTSQSGFDPKAAVKISVADASTTSIVVLNPDPTNPEILDPVGWPAGEPNIKGDEVHDPNIKGISVFNVDGSVLMNPNIKGTDPINSDIAAPNIKGPNIKGNPLNPNIKGTGLPTPNIKGESISEITWEVDNKGNTTTPYTFNVNAYYPGAPSNVPAEEAMQFQLLIYKVYTTPIATDCSLDTEEHHELVVNIPNPNIKGPNIKGSALTAGTLQAESAKDAKFYLKPGEKALVKLWAIDPKVGNGDDFDFGDSIEESPVQAEVISEANNTKDLKEGNYTPPGDTSLPPGPALVSPTAGAELDNGCKTTPSAGSIEWDFGWTDVPGATAYHLYVFGPPNMTIPLIDDSTIDASNSSYHYSSPGSYVDDTNLSGWIWRVRALVNGTWTAWSEERSFDVAPPTDCQGTPAGYTISGKVYYSTTPLDGVKTDLRLGTNIVQTTTSANGGAYSFSSVAPGTYNVEVNALSSEYAFNVGIQVNVSNADVIQDMDLPKNITLLSPPTGNSVYTQHPTLVWTANPQASTYTVQINKTTNWDLVEQKRGLSTNSYTVQPTLEFGTNYTWQVDAYDAAWHWVGTTPIPFTLTPEIPAGGEINIKQGATNIADGGSFDFGTETLGSNADITFTIENTGGTDLALTGSPYVTITGANADQFSVQWQPPTATVAPSQSSDFVIRFHPTSSGSKTASLSIANDDSDENPYDITLLGNGTAGILFSTFNGDTVDSLPQLGGANQPVSLIIGPSCSILVRSSANGVSTQPVEISDPGTNAYSAVNYQFNQIDTGIIGVEATVSFSRLMGGYFLQTATNNNAVITRLSIGSDGRIYGYGSYTLGYCQANRPFRVRMLIDIVAQTWSAVMDDEMNGFDDDPVVSGIPFSNTGITNISQALASLNPDSGEPAVSIVYDDIFVYIQQ
jgi:hypothetical protein